MLGESTGTLIGLTYANLFPRRVRAMALDGVEAPVASSPGPPRRWPRASPTPTRPSGSSCGCVRWPGPTGARSPGTARSHPMSSGCSGGSPPPDPGTVGHAAGRADLRRAGRQRLAAGRAPAPGHQPVGAAPQGWAVGAPCTSWPARAASRYSGPWNATTASPILLVGPASAPTRHWSTPGWPSGGWAMPPCSSTTATPISARPTRAAASLRRPAATWSTSAPRHRGPSALRPPPLRPRVRPADRLGTMGSAEPRIERRHHGRNPQAVPQPH